MVQRKKVIMGYKSAAQRKAVHASKAEQKAKKKRKTKKKKK
jgi:hypothetical protein